MSKSPKNDNRTAAKNDNRPTARRPHPWSDINGIDYGPAIAALGDLIAWTFDLATRDVADWPEGQRRVRSTRRYVMSRLRGRHPRGAPYEDILFTAGLLARIFENEIGLGMSEMVDVFDQLGLPTEVVPLMPRVQPHARIPLARPRYPSAVRDALAAAIEVLDLSLDDDCDPEPCDECGRPRHRNAA